MDDLTKSMHRHLLSPTVWKLGSDEPLIQSLDQPERRLPEMWEWTKPRGSYSTWSKNYYGKNLQ